MKKEKFKAKLFADTLLVYKGEREEKTLKGKGQGEKGNNSQKKI